MDKKNYRTLFFVLRFAFAWGKNLGTTNGYIRSADISMPLFIRYFTLAQDGCETQAKQNVYGDSNLTLEKHGLTKETGLFKKP